ncbi:MAG: 50S ribosomal L9 C-terminal domain-containing protein [Enterobacteriaceae bacterium PSpyr]|nr:MAG: 50S ribosomal L9 C-terminal domain-containing protein [Enterobacteriaceae bacterium PSpyr]
MYNNKTKFIIKNKKNILNNNINIKNKKLFINLYFKCNNNGYLFFSINNKKIILIINNYNIKIKKKFLMKSIRKIGEYIIKIKTSYNSYKIILFKILNKI